MGNHVVCYDIAQFISARLVFISGLLPDCTRSRNTWCIFGTNEAIFVTSSAAFFLLFCLFFVCLFDFFLLLFLFCFFIFIFYLKTKPLLKRSTVNKLEI